MSIMSDSWIIEQSKNKDMISPFVQEQKNKGIISYGVSSYGYDARCAPEFKLFLNETNAKEDLIDPKNFNPKYCKTFSDTEFIMPANSFVLSRTIEYFKIPKDILVICLGKSTYARCGIIINVTPLEPGWEGHVTLEFSNTNNFPVKIYANEGVCQFLFFKGDQECQVNYSDRDGKYMKQMGVTFPKVRSL